MAVIQGSVLAAQPPRSRAEQSKNHDGLRAKRREENAPGSTRGLAPRAPMAQTNPQMTNQPLHTRIKEEKTLPVPWESGGAGGKAHFYGNWRLLGASEMWGEANL